MINREIIQRAKNVSITAWLEANGYKCTHKGGRNSRFENPLREESNHSFDVNEKLNLWYDRGTNQGGDIIDLVMKYRKCGFLKAVAELTCLSVSFSFRRPEKFITDSQPKIELLKIKKLENAALLQYLCNRGIDLAIAKKYLQEAYYQVNGRRYFSLAFPNIRGGYELRNLKYKGCVGKKAISVNNGEEDTKDIFLFEGFMDFLSYLTIHVTFTPKYKSIVLNSLSFINEDLKEMLIKHTVHTYLDNDESGKKAVLDLEDYGIKIIDHSNEYSCFKDYNAYLISIS